MAVWKSSCSAGASDARARDARFASAARGGAFRPRVGDCRYGARGGRRGLRRGRAAAASMDAPPTRRRGAGRGGSRDARANPPRAGNRAMTGAIVVALVLGVPAAAFAIWPLLRARGRPASLLPLPPDERDQLLEAKRVALSALRELDFEHAAGYVSDPDYAELGARYEAEAAETLRALDALRPAPTPPAAPSPAPIPASGWRHPAALAMAAVALLVFGVALGVGIVRYTEPDRMADAAPTGSRPLASLEGAP